MKTVPSYERVREALSPRWRLDCRHGAEWVRLIEETPWGPPHHFDASTDDTWSAELPHLIRVTGMMPSAEELARLKTHYPEGMESGAAVRCGLRSYVASADEEGVVKATIPGGALHDRIEVSAFIVVASGGRKGLRVWSSPVQRIELGGKGTMFPIERRCFVEDWKWFELVLPEDAEGILDKPFDCQIRLLVDDRKTGWKDLQRCLSTGAAEAKRLAACQLSSLVLTSLVEWARGLDEADQASLLNASAPRHGPRTIGWIMWNLLHGSASLGVQALTASWSLSRIPQRLHAGAGTEGTNAIS